jgi:translation initiation factor 5
MEPIRGKTAIIDPYYRYKMRKMNVQRERTKTSISNLNDVAVDLKIPDASLIVSFMKKKLAIAITFKNDRVIVTNDVDVKNLQNALYEFIEYFVLCKKCKLPELSYSLENEQLVTDCRSCGVRGSIEKNHYTEKIIKEFELKMSLLVKKNKKIKKVERGPKTEKEDDETDTDNKSNTMDISFGLYQNIDSLKNF